MKDIRSTLPPMASDTAGACSMLFETGGVTVIHDAAGSMEVFITFEEQRPLDTCRTVTSQLTALEAITGNDQILIDKLTAELAAHPAPFAAIVGTPVPHTIATDLDGIAAEVEAAAHTPVFAVNAGGFRLYDYGAGEALKKLLSRFVQPPKGHAGRRVNLLGAFPMDLSGAELEGVRAQLLGAGFDTAASLTLNGSLDEITSAAEADLNLVISMAGLPAAKWMEQKFHIPYLVGLPFAADDTRKLLSQEEESFPESGKTVLILGDAVFAVSLGSIVRRMGFAPTLGFEAGGLPTDLPMVPLDTEAHIRQALRGDYDLIVADPLYRLLLPKDSRAVLIPRPHQALSSRLHKPAEQPLGNILLLMEEET